MPELNDEEVISRDDVVKKLIASMVIMEPKSANEASGIICMLTHLDERYKSQPFSLVFNDIFGSIMNRFYVIIGLPIKRPDGTETIQPMAFITWAMLDPAVSVVKANNIRPIAPVEFNSGPNGYFNMFVSPFEQPDIMLEVLRTKSSKLQELSSVTFVDKLFKPDYNFKQYDNKY